MKKSLVAFALLGFLGVASADPPPGWPGRYAVVGSSEVWTQPTGPLTSPTEATFTAATGGGVTATSLIAPILADGRAVALTVYRAIAGSTLLAAAGTALGTPLGMVASAASVAYLATKIPAFLEWISGDGGVHVRIGPTTGQIEKNLGGDTNLVYQTGNYCTMTPLSAAINCAYGANTVTRNITSNSFEYWRADLGVWMQAGYTAIVRAEEWVPASMDDIAPYMTARPPPSNYAAQLLALGVTLAANPISMSGPASLAEPAPYVQTIQYPKQVDQTSTTVAMGNPFNLPDNQPFEQVSTESIMTGPGSITATGGASLGYDALAPAPLAVPMTRTVTSTFNPATNQTTTTTTTSPHGAVVVKTYTPTTTLSTTPTTSTVSKQVTVVTTTTDTVTGQTLVNNETKTETKPLVPPVATPTDCEKSPSNIGCAAFGQPPSPDLLVKSSIPVSITSIAFAGSSSCPAPLSFSAFSGSYAVSYQPLCDKLAVLRGLFVAIAGVIAAYIVITAFKV